MFELRGGGQRAQRRLSKHVTRTSNGCGRTRSKFTTMSTKAGRGATTLQSMLFICQAEIHRTVQSTNRWRVLAVANRANSASRS